MRFSFLFLAFNFIFSVLSQNTDTSMKEEISNPKIDQKTLKNHEQQRNHSALIIFFTVGVLLFGLIKLYLFIRLYRPHLLRNQNIFSILTIFKEGRIHHIRRNNRRQGFIVPSSSHSNEEHNEIDLTLLENALKIENESIRQINEEESQENSLCDICYGKPKAILLEPCNHMPACAHCTRKIIRTKNTCPLCRTKITGYQVGLSEIKTLL